MFERKYKPSIEKNNALKEKAVNELNSLLYQVKKGRIKSKVSQEELLAAFAPIESTVKKLDNAYGDGKEDIGLIYEKVHNLIDKMKRSAQRDLLHRINDVASDLDYNIKMWIDVLDGVTVPDGDVTGTKWDKRSRSVRKLEKKLSEVANIRNQFEDFSNDSEKEIVDLEKDKLTLEDDMSVENNERKLNELDRALNSVEAMLNAESIRKESYSACSNLLENIYFNAKALIKEGVFSKDQLNKAKAYLDLDRIRNVLTDPQKALTIIKVMQRDIEKIRFGTNAIDIDINKIAQNTVKIDGTIGSSATTVNASALARKEAILAKKRALETSRRMEEDMANLKDTNNTTTNTMEEIK